MSPPDTSLNETEAMIACICLANRMGQQVALRIFDLRHANRPWTQVWKIVEHLAIYADAAD